ncbi:MAG: hypothetical protein R3B82_24280 [Sandaracinaceae bacterium]
MTRWRGATLTGAMWLVAASAHAAPGVYEDGICIPLSTATDCSAGDTCTDGAITGTCVAIGSTGYCLPTDTLLCCMGDIDCPSTSAAMFGTCLTGGMGGGLCITPGALYCNAMGTRPTRAQFDACHHFAGGSVYLPWAEGDCDGDQIPNGLEVRFETDPCLAPARQAIWVAAADDCRPLPIGCDPSAECATPAGDAGDCVPTDDGGATVCAPRDTELYCGDGEWVCPAGQIEVVDPAEGHTFCTPPYCGPDVTLTTAACVHDPRTDRPTLPEDGDCDGDDIPNRRDDMVCVADVDGGVAPGDAGMVVVDDGGVVVTEDGGASGEDASVDPTDGGGMTADGGANVAPTFGGGGGCACRASRAPRTAPGALVLLGLGLFSLRAARRARRTRRGDRARRCRR